MVGTEVGVSDRYSRIARIGNVTEALIDYAILNDLFDFAMISS